ncbi:MAG: formate--tetrahydrofolate ligase [Planctomycetaceae bacterium]|nr:formate--tetrahydrofolate ligase [Planctomycetota bacterium]NUN51613.1 formate--tetrahydrofolate ligase [Planctomycetaceae bacterium]
MKREVKSDLDIAQAARLEPITRIAAGMGLAEEDLEPYGRYKAKVHLDVLKKFENRPLGKLIVVTAITPTPLGEGKTVTTIGVSQGLKRIGKRVVTTLRQPSMGPVFGIKGGAAGGGYSQVVPMEDLNLHFTGDIHAVGAAHNLLSAMIDNHLHQGNALRVEPSSISWLRCVDISDRALRKIVVGLGGKENGLPRESGYCITVASEVMAVLALATSQQDLRARLARMVWGFDRDGKPLTAEDLGAAGAMTVLLKDALQPNLIQTLEGGPVLVHAGPFANIAHGNNSVLADMIALRCADYVVTEAGFGADNGMIKFMEIKCRQSGLRPSGIVMTCSIRALKMHGGVGKVVAGKPLPKELSEENIPGIEAGAANLRHCIKVAKYYGVPLVVTINRFATDTDREVEALRRIALDAGADACEPITAWADGGDGCRAAAEAVVKATERKADFRFLCDEDASIEQKIETLATKVYNAASVSYSGEAKAKIKRYEKLGWSKLPICMAKSHLSLSHDKNLKNLPSGYVFPINDVKASVGAGFLYPLAGDFPIMPGLPSHPAAMDVDVDPATGLTKGLF